jgi:hypothetical protein
MGMPRHVPVAKIRIPDVIRLPDGREVAVRDLVLKQRDRRSYNLRTGTEYGSRTRRKITKGVDTETES